MHSRNSDWLLITVLGLIKFILPFILVSPEFELHRDEYLYYQQGQHLDLGYLENPPLLSYLGTISGWLGGTEFWIRSWAALTGSITLVIACLITKEFGGRKFAILLTGLGMITGAFLRVHSLFQPNVLDILFWTLALYFLLRYIKTNDRKFIFSIAISLAAGWWSKYSIIFLVAALLIALFTTVHRKVFARRFTYLAAGIAILLIIPNLWWQFDHHWPVLHHMQELQETQLQHLEPADFIKDQLLFLVPVIFVWITGLVWLFRNNTYRVFAITYVFVIALLMAGSGKSYYALGIYPILIAVGAMVLEKWTGTRKWIRLVFLTLVIVLTLPFIPLLLPVWDPPKLASFYEHNDIGKTGLLKWEDLQDHPLPQDFADMLGWKELATKTEKFYQSLPDSLKSESMIFCRNYGQAGALKFYGKDADFINRAFSDNGSFLLWIPDRLYFRHLVFVGSRMPGKDDEVFNHFESSFIADSVSNSLSRQFGNKIIFFRNIDSAGLTIARNGLRKEKADFNR